MTNDKTDQAAGTPASPRVFISHRHADGPIADVLRSFIRSSTAGAVEVFQSSYSGSGPEIGNLLTEELGKELDLAQVVLLVYTVPDEDWSYCMWETGVAFNPRRKDTRIVVVQCGEDAPAPLADRARVRVASEESVKTLVKQLLTDKEFFPGLGRAVTRFSPDGEDVVRAGEELYQSLRDVIPAEPEDEWPAWPLLRLELPLDRVVDLRDAVAEERHGDADAWLLEHCEIVAADQFASALFGTPSFRKGCNLAELVEEWTSNNRDSDSRWVGSLLGQLKRGALWQFPQSDWAVLRHAASTTWYAPILLHVRKSPSKGSMQFDYYFPRFEVDEASGRIRCHVPEQEPAG